MQYVELFSFITGVVCVIMQITQHKYMWYFNIMSAAAALAVALNNSLWGVSTLNAYFIVMACIGIAKWRKMKAKGDGDEASGIFMHRLSVNTLIISIVAAAAIFGGFYYLLHLTADPHPILDSLTFSMSMVAAWWLARAYKFQWLCWIAADIIGLALYINQGLFWLSALYASYIVSATIGFIIWNKKGIYV